MAPSRIALAQIDATVGDFAGNAAKVRDRTERARAAGATLCLFPELCLTGYPPRDLLDLPEFLDRADRTLAELAQPAEWSRGIAVVLGFPERARGAPPPSVYNSAALVEGGRVVAVGRKSLLPTYDVFDETRYFLASASCTAAGASLVVNISASPYALGKPALRERMLGATARSHRVPVAYVNQVGGNDSLIFDGGSMLIGAGGEVLARAPLLREALLVVGLDGSAPAVLLEPPGEAMAPPGPPPQDPESTAEELFRALVLGVRDYVAKCGFRSAVIGLSGGIDSALTACIAAAALGPGNVLGVAMPSRYSSAHSREDAAALARNLGIGFKEIPIEPMHAAYDAELSRALGPLCDLAAQNVQARVRGQILMAISNQTGGLVLSTGNKSELAVGYCTLYGDMAGGLAVIGDLPKTLVYAVSRAGNRLAGRELIPERTFTKPPSAELKPDQTDQDTLPPYDQLDDILAAYVEERLPLEAIVARGHPPETVRRVLRMVMGSEYKRRQAAPVLKVTGKAFGEGRRFPIAQGYRH